MRRVVLDASVVLTWFAGSVERRAAAAADVRRKIEAGALEPVVPSLLFLEVLNVAGRRWGWSAPHLTELGRLLNDLPFQTDEPALADIADWIGRGLTAYDAAYVALAAMHGIPLLTSDAKIIAIAPGIAVELGA